MINGRIIMVHGFIGNTYIFRLFREVIFSV
jgi:hypothetical protein